MKRFVSKCLNKARTAMTRAAGEKGFTLVELVVVIAILGILAGVGAVGYSGYVKKANMAADQQLISQVKTALELHHYANPTVAADGSYVILSTEKTEANVADGFAAAAMDAAFGADWDKLVLKHNGWMGVSSDKAFADAYKASSYNGNEDALITQVGSVTNLLKDALASSPDLVGDSFSRFLTTNNIDKNDNQAVSNAAILYAADTIGKMDATKEAAVNAAFSDFYNPSSSAYGQMGDLTLALRRELGTFGAVAAIYAHGEAFGQYVASQPNGDTQLLDDFHAIDISSVTDTDAALTQVANNMGTLVYAAQTDPTINPFAMQYIGESQYAKDVTAYLESMKKINANADKFEDNLSDAGCYTDGTAAALLQAAVNAGSIGEEGIASDDGEVIVWFANGTAGDTVSGIQD